MRKQKNSKTRKEIDTKTYTRVSTVVHFSYLLHTIIVTKIITNECQIYNDFALYLFVWYDRKLNNVFQLKYALKRFKLNYFFIDIISDIDWAFYFNFDSFKVFESIPF